VHRRWDELIAVNLSRRLLSIARSPRLTFNRIGGGYLTGAIDTMNYAKIGAGEIYVNILRFTQFIRQNFYYKTIRYQDNIFPP